MIYLNDDPVKVTLFPDRTSQVWKLDESHLNQEQAIIRWEFTHEGEIMQLAQLKNLLDLHVPKVNLHIEYLPYARQDKWIANNTTFALYTFANILNSLEFDEVTIVDPHSIEAILAINKAKAVYPHIPLFKAWELTRSDLVCYPDKGARTKYTEIYKNYPFIYGEKVRDQATGHITNYDLFLSENIEGKRLLIIDDICDGGKTFELLADQVLSLGVEEVNLFVTHGIFSKGLIPLRNAGIKRIFTNKGEAMRFQDGVKYRNFDK